MSSTTPQKISKRHPAVTPEMYKHMNPADQAVILEDVVAIIHNAANRWWQFGGNITRIDQCLPWLEAINEQQRTAGQPEITLKGGYAQYQRLTLEAAGQLHKPIIVFTVSSPEAMRCARGATNVVLFYGGTEVQPGSTPTPASLGGSQA